MHLFCESNDKMITVLQVSESFKGCMLELKLNDELTDIVNAAGVQGLQNCYKTVERGAYFPGFGEFAEIGKGYLY